jgi:adenylate cyclase
MERKLAAIFSADVKGYSRLMGEDDVGTIRTLTAYREVMTTLIQHHRGRVVDSPGDNLLAEFASVVDAVHCAVEVQQALKAKNAELPDQRKMEFRIGINLGDVVVEGERLYGDGVNIAARVEGLATPGGICLSGIAHDQVKHKLALTYENLGAQAVKNIAEAIPVWRVAMDEAAAALARQPLLHQPSPEKPKGGAAHLSRSVWVLAGVLLIVGTLATFLSPSLLTFRPQHSTHKEPALPLPDKPSIAVLPFTNMSGDPEQDYFSDGLTETLITDLSKISGLFVIARHSVFTYKGQAVKVEQVSQELGVRYVLEGSVQKADNRARINVQLVDGTTGGHLWAERYDRPFANLFTLQDELIREVVAVLHVEMQEAELKRVQRVPSENLTAYEFVLRGLAALNRVGYENSQAANAQARQFFDKALALDPTYAAACALLGATHFNDWLFLWNFTPETLERAATLAQKAVGLDHSLPLPHLTLGVISLWQKNHEQGMAEIEQAIALDPNWADAYAQLGQALGFVGRPEEGIEVITKAMRLNPRFPNWYLLYLGQEYRNAERCEEALTPLKKGVARNPDFGPARVNLAVCYAHLGRQQEAEAELAKVLQLWPTWALEVERQSAPYKNPADLERYLDGLRKAGLK